MKGFGQEGIEGNMWTQIQMAKEIERMAQQELFRSKIQPQMKRIVYLTLKACQNQVTERKNSVELFGYDFMIDSCYNPWLIEINSSPSMDYSTKITENLVKAVLSDAVKVIIDYGQNKNKAKTIETGKFELITKKGKLYLP